MPCRLLAVSEPLLPAPMAACATQVLLERAPKEFPKDAPPPLRFVRSCSSSLAPATMKALEDTFKVGRGRCWGV